jgi:peroxiredoxin/tetratricopeptide (TPR) repeat protein
MFFAFLAPATRASGRPARRRGATCRLPLRTCVLPIAVWLAAIGLYAASTAAGRAADPPASDASPPAAGHSSHGESFNDGPRQRAYLMGNTGSVSFPATTESPEAQKFIDQGIGQLHGFWYFEAERSFRQAARFDPKCAIAYWGMAQANTNNAARAKGFLAEAVKRKEGASEREVMYIDALDAFYKAESKKDKNKERYEAYAKALERIIYKFPADIEARAMLALQLWQNRSHGSPITSHLAVDALLKEVLAVEPMHPCHHYRIHLWDDERAENALDSAARCGQSAPGIAHMWHMSGHIFSDLHRYADAAWQQEASARVDHAYMLRDRILPDQIHNYAHNNEWLIRDESHIGRVHDAIALARNLIELPRHPQHNSLTGGKSAHFGRLRLFEELVRYELWDELIALCDTVYLEPTDNSAEQVKRLRSLGVAWLRKGEIGRGIELIRMLEERLASERHKLNIARPVLAQAASTAAADDEPRPESVPLPTPEDDGRLKPMELAIEELRGHLAVEQGDYRAGLPLLRKAGGVSAVYLAKVELLAGDRESALKNGRDAISNHKAQVQPLADFIELLWKAGEEKEAAERFQELREMSGHLDLDMPVFARLAPIGERLGFTGDWRIASAQAHDVGDRPPLDSLGPALWQPCAAPDWELVDSQGGRIGSSPYHGRPTVILFYLGHECLHCAEQLQAFAPMAREFDEAGIALVAVSSDDDAGLAKSIENYKPGVFPFPLAADPVLTVFKSFRAYDDFEERPLHATFFVDGRGLVRWQDISFEPFRDARFVLNEARRLLAISALKNAAAAPAVLPAGAPATTCAGSDDAP